MKRILIAVFSFSLLLLSGCNGNRHNAMLEGKELVTTAENLSIRDMDGYSLVTVRNPWDTTRNLASYILVEHGKAVPEGIDTVRNTVIRVPLRNSLVMSNIYVSLIHELGMLESVRGVCDTDYITDSVARGLVTSGVIRDCGQSFTPNVEAIMKMRPDGIVISPMSGNDNHGKLANLRIPMIEAADYLEQTPLGRAEWVKFYGRLFGQAAKADSMFNATEAEYNDIHAKVAYIDVLPKVLFDGVYGQVWNLPTSRSVTGNMIKDAAAWNPFDSSKSPGSVQLAPEKVLYKAGDADVWFVRYFKDKDMTLSAWGKENPNYSRIKAFRNGNVYGSNTAYSGVFDDAAFHPQWILADMVRILHPQVKGIPVHKQYYHRLEP